MGILQKIGRKQKVNKTPPVFISLLIYEKKTFFFINTQTSKMSPLFVIFQLVEGKVCFLVEISVMELL